jgi:hypothetical protein
VYGVACYIRVVGIGVVRGGMLREAKKGPPPLPLTIDADELTYEPDLNEEDVLTGG